MRLKSICLILTAIIMTCSAVLADQIVLKDGTAYSGKFVRGDSSSITFRVLGRTENFKLEEVSHILFKEPEIALPAAVPASAPASAAVSSADAPVLETPAPDLQVPPEPAPDYRRARKIARTDSVQTPVSSRSTVFPVGAPLSIRTSSAIDTDRNRVGDVFEATLEEALVSDGRTVVPRGSLVKGRIAFAKESGKLAGRSELILELTELFNNGESYLLNTSDYAEIGASRGNRTAATVGGTAALGAIIGAIAGGGTGAAIGAASGAAVGTGVQVVTRGETIKIPAETVLEFKLQTALTIN